MNTRWAGLVLVTLVAWNAAFVAQPRFGIFLSVGVAALLCVARASAVPTPWRDLLAPHPKPLAIGLLAAAGLILATAVLRGPLLGAWPALRGDVRALYGMFLRPSALEAYVALPLIAIAEELVFRGAIQTGLGRRLGAYGASAGAAVLYAVAHLESRNPSLVALALVLGAFWGALRARTASLWPGLLSHVLWDLFVVVWFPLR